VFYRIAKLLCGFRESIFYCVHLLYIGIRESWLWLRTCINPDTSHCEQAYAVFCQIQTFSDVIYGTAVYSTTDIYQCVKFDYSIFCRDWEGLLHTHIKQYAR